jgi:uncharacterized protein
MMRRQASGLVCQFVAIALSISSAQADSGKRLPTEAGIINSRVIQFTSAIDGEPYTLQVSIPLWAPPKGGYPVIYVLDGEFFFPTAAIESDELAHAGAVVVGIDHDAQNDKAVIAHFANHKPGQPVAINSDAGVNAWSLLRTYDFTWPSKPQHRGSPFVQSVNDREDKGHVDAFLSVIEKEIKPKVAAIAPIDKSNQALFGHSLGGLAVIRALFTEPNAFRSFVAASPSLWYDGGAIFDGEKKFAAAVKSGAAAPRILITNGALEVDNTSPPRDYIATLQGSQRAEMVAYAKMRDGWPGMKTGARALVTRLKALSGKPGYTVNYMLIADEDHDPSAFVAIGRAITFAFGAPRYQ